MKELEIANLIISLLILILLAYHTFLKEKFTPPTNEHGYLQFGDSI